MKQLVKVFLLTLAIFFIAGCGGSTDPGELALEKVKGGKLIADVPANVLKQELIKKGIADENTTVFGFKAYKISYNTTDEENNTVKASGIIVVPSDYNADAKAKQTLEYMHAKGLAMVVDCHGTIFSNNEAPSVAVTNSASAEGVGLIFTSLSGFVTLQPDYIGFGDSNSHYQPYLLEKSSANSVVDFTKAAIKFAKENNIPIAQSKDTYLTGYSQGGYVALAALKKFQEQGYIVNLTVPMSGPYLLDPIAKGVLSSDTIGVPSFMAATAYSYTKAYKKPATTLIQEPYASKLPTLFDGSLTRVEIDAKLTHKVKGENGLFTDEIAENYDGSWFQQALQLNSVVDFSPKTPIKMLHCLGDDVIPYQISQVTKDAFENQLNAVYIDLTPVEVALTQDPNTQLRYTHTECGLPSYKVAAYIFTKARKSSALGY